METFEKIVHFDEEGNTTLKLGKDFSKKEAKVLVFLRDEEISEEDWLKLAVVSKSYDFLNDPSEDIYTMEDGKPYKRLGDEV
ncbi:MAG: hypothetical protein ACTHNG_05740 [Ginsengibacter sp.]